MIVEKLLERARNAGVDLTVDGQDLRCRGPQDAISALIPELKAHKPELLAALATAHPIFQWLPLNHETYQEALGERIGILMDSGIDEAQAAQEARWHLERSSCWNRFQGHARIMLEAPDQRRMLAQYRQDAELVFGQKIAEHMTKTMQAWIARQA